MNSGFRDVKKFMGSCCGNSFLVLDERDVNLDDQANIEFAVKNLTKYDLDSALVLTRRNEVDVFIEIIERDGSMSNCCGNGAMLVANFLGLNDGKIGMRGGSFSVHGTSDTQSILVDTDLLELSGSGTGKDRLFQIVKEPHIVYMVDHLDDFELVENGKRTQEGYMGGVNVNAVQKIGKACYGIRTYERGVFSETKSCGTGSLASYVAVASFNEYRGIIAQEVVEFRSRGGVHWVSGNGEVVRLTTLNKFCKIQGVKEDPND